MEDLMKEAVRPSEVFLELWQTVTSLDCELPAEDFARYAQAWRQIVSLEEIYAEAERRKRTLEKFASWAKEPMGAAEGSRENVTTIAMADNSAGGASPSPTTGAEGGQTYDCASAPMPDPEEVKATEVPDSRPAGKPSLVIRIERLWNRGVSMNEFLAADPGLTLNDVQDAMNRKSLAHAKFEKLSIVCEKLEKEHPDPEEVTHANRSAGGKAGFATRKRNLTERLEGLRRDGHKLHEIAEAVPGLTINDVMDGLNARSITPMKIQALERACRKLEEAQAGG